MSCFICESIDQNLINVNSEFTKFSKIVFKEIVCAFVTKHYEFEIYDEDVMCQTCKILLDNLDEYYYKARQIENICMAQIYRKYQVETRESHIYDINEKQLRLFNMVPFTKQCVYTCEQCGFVTNYEDCIVPHYKFHEDNDGQNDTCEDEDDNENQQLYECDICSTTVSGKNLMAFHSELFHNSRPIIKSELIKIETDVDAQNSMNFSSEINAAAKDEKQYVEEPRPDLLADDVCGMQSEIQLAEIVHLRCPLCEFCSLQIIGIKNHIVTAHGKLSFKSEWNWCNMCEVTFNNLNDIILHAECHPETTFKCCVCALVSSSPEDIVKHFKESHLDSNISFTEEDPAESSEETYTESPEVIASEILVTKFQQSDREIKNVLANTCDRSESELTYSKMCNDCSMVFSSADIYIHHLHNKHNKCDKCPTKCQSKKSLDAHIKRRHTKYECQYCDKTLGSKSSLDAHLTIHGLNTVYTCNECGKGFKAKSLYETHMEIHKKEYNYTCHICGQKFIHQRSHRIHVQWHDNPRPHKCPMCEKTYKHRSHLAVHRRSHFGERPNACPHCERRFTSASKLKVHLVIHTGIFSHPCQVCSKGFMKRYKLAEHLAKIHDDNSMLLNKPKCEYKVAVRPDTAEVISREN